MKLLNHNQLRKQREATAHLEPLIASNDGYVLTKAGRLAFRMLLGEMPVQVIRSETNDLGLDTKGISSKEAFDLLSRINQMPDVEGVTLELQAISARMRKLLLKAKLERNLSDKTIVEITMLLRDTEKYT